ncbi:MAG: hypothetical protein K6T68_13700 [Alicyclobacillus shizuokensis]|nr:hypothetical protein [Alicyclobacillus shizuokensis]
MGLSPVRGHVTIQGALCGAATRTRAIAAVVRRFAHPVVAMGAVSSLQRILR